MVRLIVEEGGERRAFRLGAGVLTVGSGREARLRLSSTDVAELHAEIEVKGETAVIRPRPGVMPPLVGGAPAKGEMPLAVGQVVTLGGARIWLEDEAGATAPSATAPAAPSATPPSPSTPPPPPVSASRSGGAGSGGASEDRRQAAMRSARQTGRRAVVERTAPRVKKGLPPVAVVFIVLGVVAVILLVLRYGLSSMEKTTLSVDNVLAGAREDVEEGRWSQAHTDLGLLDGMDLSDEQRAEREAILAIIDQTEVVADRHDVHDVGTQWMNTFLEKYEVKFLQGNPAPERIRLFLERCRGFRKRWPDHPQMEWVDRQESRFEGAVNLSAPMDLAFVKWKMRFFVDARPRYYDDAFELLDEFEGIASPDERTELATMRADMITNRQAYADDQLQWAKYEFEKKNNPNKAVWWLVNSVLHLGEPILEDEAARYLIRMPNLAGHLRGYEDKYPEMFEDLMKNAIVREKAEEIGVY